MSAYKEGTNAMANAATLPLSNIIQGWHCDASEMCSQRAREKGRMEKMNATDCSFFYFYLFSPERTVVPAMPPSEFKGRAVRHVTEDGKKWHSKANR